MPNKRHNRQRPNILDAELNEHTKLNNVQDAMSPPGQQSIQSTSETLFFDDGVRRIDCILAYEPGSYSDESEQKKAGKRSEFEKNLVEMDLELEYEPAETSQNGRTCFVKVHAPWEVLTRAAEILSLKMPVMEMEAQKKSLLRSWVDRLLKNNCFMLPKRFHTQEKSYFTAAFLKENEKLFLIKDKRTFFSPAQRTLLVMYMLSRASYDPHRKDRIGVKRLLANGTYLAAYPLHEVLSKPKGEEFLFDLLDVGSYRGTTNGVNDRSATRALNARQLLYETWARPKRWFKYQPLNLVRSYYGEKIALYFAWLGMYTKLLIPAALVGLICVIFGASTLYKDVPSYDVCDESGVGSIVMCPQCDKFCDYWFLNSSCLYSQFTYVFDNFSTVIFAVFMSVWATLFLEVWKRRLAELTWDWDLADYELQEEEAVRPEYAIKAKKIAPDSDELHLPFSHKVLRIVGSALTVLFFLCLVLAFLFGVVVYRVIVVHLLDAEIATIGTSVSAALINLVAIVVLGKVYSALAWHLTNFECPKTQTEFENSYTFKVFLFNFINYYSSLFYIAFFKGKIVLNWWRNRVAKSHLNPSNAYSRWEQDFNLTPVSDDILFPEYLEMVLQYGFVTLFVAAFPLAPLFALLNNVIEIRLDAYKFVTAYRRPEPRRAHDIGVWYRILDGISWIAVATNACVIAFTSDFVPRMLYLVVYGKSESLEGYVQNSLSYFDTKDFSNFSVPIGSIFESNYGDVSVCRYRDYRHPPCSTVGQVAAQWSSRQKYMVPHQSQCHSLKYDINMQWWHVFAARLAFVIIFEHLVFLVKGFVAYLIPDIPKDIYKKMQKEEILARQARFDAIFQSKAQKAAAQKIINDVESETVFSSVSPSNHTDADDELFSTPPLVLKSFSSTPSKVGIEMNQILK